jgi:glycosyltransferase involved in cell wall biosynthesis
VHVVLTSYNRRAYLEQSLDSVLAQSFSDLHVLVVDDASPDGAGDLARDYERRFPGRVTALCKPARRGYIHSMNLGLAQLRGRARHVAFHYDDDLWHPRKLEAQMNALADRSDVGLVATEAAIIDERGEPHGQLFSEIYGRPDVDRLARRMFWRGNCLCAPSVLITRQALELVQPYIDVEGGCNDMDMWLTISAQMPASWLEEPLTYYRQSGGQMTKVRSRHMFHETYAVRERAFERSAAVRQAVGGEEARARLDGDAVFWAAWCLGHLDLSSYGWYAWKVVKRRRPRLVLQLAYETLRALPRALASAARALVRRDAPGENGS